jgi:hypothetical protein
MTVVVPTLGTAFSAANGFNFLDCESTIASIEQDRGVN